MFQERVKNIWYLKDYWVMVLKGKGNIIEDINDILGWTIRWFWYWTETGIPGKGGALLCLVVLRLGRNYEISFRQDFEFPVRHQGMLSQILGNQKGVLNWCYTFLNNSHIDVMGLDMITQRDSVR